MAFFSLNKIDLDMLKAREKENARRIPQMLDQPRILMATLLIANTISNISVIFILNYLVELLVSVQRNLILSVSLKIVLISLVLLLFSEVLPKVYATHNNLRMALFASPLVHNLLDIFRAPSKSLVEISDWLGIHIFGQRSSIISMKDINEAIDLSVDKSASEEERDILRGIIKFGNITVKQIMKTRLDVSGVPYHTEMADLISLVSDLHYSRLPVFRNDLDEIVGIVHTKDLLPHISDATSFDWHSIIRPAYFIHENKLIEDLLREFQSKRMHFAVVVDEFGGTNGIVTLEDIMEEIVGDIRDEFDEEEFHYSKVDDRTFLFEGKTMLNDVCRIMDIPTDTFEQVKGHSDSLGGLVLELAGAFPEVGTVLSLGGFELTVLEIEKNRIQKVKITQLPETVEFD